MRRWRLGGTLVLGAWLVAAPAGRAATVTWLGTGSVIASSAFPQIAIGDPGQVALSFDPATPDGLPADPTSGFYPGGSGSVLRIEVESATGSKVFVCPTSTILVRIDAPGDTFLAIGNGCTDPLGSPMVDMSVLFDDPTGTALASDALPAAPLAPADFTDAAALLEGCASPGCDPRTDGYAVVVGVQTLVVPEPSAAGGALTSLAALAGVGARRRREPVRAARTPTSRSRTSGSAASPACPSPPGRRGSSGPG
jgi:hypothetical protein